MSGGALPTSTPTAGVRSAAEHGPRGDSMASQDGEPVGVESSCTCGSPSMFALNPNEAVIHRQDAPCFIAISTGATS